MKKIAILGVACAALTVSACATITRGTSTDWQVDTDPQGAQVTTSNGFNCAHTPCSLRMSRESTFTARVTLDGYEPETISVSHELATGGGAGFAGNVLVGGLIGMTVDANSGATQDLVPNPVFIRLRPVETPAPAAAGQDSGE